jgi:DNA-binding transcriptional LysR family regulator
VNDVQEYERYLDTVDLKLIDLLYSTRSVSKTAELMGQHQPKISTWLKQIREKLKDPLFVRTSQGMEPTPRATVVVAKAREILDAMRQIVDVPDFDPMMSSRTFRMCIPDGAQTTLLPNLLSNLFSKAPDIKFEALPLDRNAPRLLENGSADLAFGGFVPEMEAGFHEQTLFDQGYVCLISAQHPRIRDQLTLDDFQREAHVAFGYGRSFELIEAEMKLLKVFRNVRIFLPGVLGVTRIIAATDMITTLPAQIGTMLGNSNSAVRLYPCPIPLARVVVKQFWHSRLHLDPGHQWLRRICAQEARQGMEQLEGACPAAKPGSC